MALVLTQPPKERNIRNIFWVKAGRCVGLTFLPPSWTEFLEIWAPQPPRAVWVFPSLYRDCDSFTTAKWCRALVSYVMTRLRKNVLRLLGYDGTLRCKEHGESETSVFIFSATAASAASLRLVMLSWYTRCCYKNFIHLLQVCKEVTV